MDADGPDLSALAWGAVSAARAADPESVWAAAEAVARMNRQLRRAVWFEHCCDPLYAHLNADGWRLEALSRQTRIESQHLLGVKKATLRRIEQWRSKLDAHDAAIEAEHRALLAEDGGR